VPIFFTLIAIFGIRIRKITAAKMAIMKKLGGVIEESFSAIRLIASFANENKEIDKFRKLAQDVKTVAQK
jgi:ABC-type multidrug transport system fused ATPase/permease subunit